MAHMGFELFAISALTVLLLSLSAGRELKALAAWERAWRGKGGDERSRIEFLAWQVPHIVWIRELQLRLSQRKEGRVRGDGRLYKHPSSKFWWCAFYLRGKANPPVHRGSG